MALTFSSIFLFIFSSLLYLGLLFSVEASASTVSFDTALSEIQQRDTRIANKKSLTRAKDVSVTAKKLNFLPSLSLQAYENVFHSDPKTSSTSGQAELNFSLREKVANLASLSASQNDYLAALADERQQRLVIELEAASALFNFIAASQKLKILSANLVAKQEAANVAKQRFKQGRTAEEEWLKSTIEVSNATAQVTQGQSDLELARSKVEFLLGHSQIEIKWPFQQLFLNSSNIITPPFKIDQIPSYQAKVFGKNSAEDVVNQTRRNMYPDIDLFVSRNYSDSDRWNTTSGIRFRFTVFDGYKESNLLQSKKVLAEIAHNNLLAEQRKLTADHQALQKSFSNTLADAKRRDQTNKLIEKLYRTDFRRFQQGRKSFAELTIDQGRVIATQLATLDSWKKAHLDFTKVCHASGSLLTTCKRLLNSQ